ncbi:MAG: 50S ribosomal protein L6 [Sulfolobales archaeon]
MGVKRAFFVRYEERVEIPDNVAVEIQGKKVIVKGPKGVVEKDFNHARKIMIYIDQGSNEVVVKSYLGRSFEKALVGTIAAHIRNMFIGVTRGYRYYLKIIYKHFPISVSVEGDRVIVSRLLGGRDVRYAKIIGNAKVQIKDKDIIVEGIDLDAVSQTAANIERAAKISGFDRRVVIDGIYIYKKEIIGE